MPSNVGHLLHNDRYNPTSQQQRTRSRSAPPMNGRARLGAMFPANDDGSDNNARQRFSIGQHQTDDDTSEMDLPASHRSSTSGSERPDRMSSRSSAERSGSSYQNNENNIYDYSSRSQKLHHEIPEMEDPRRSKGFLNDEFNSGRAIPSSKKVSYAQEPQCQNACRLRYIEEADESETNLGAVTNLCWHTGPSLTNVILSALIIQSNF